MNESSIDNIKNYVKQNHFVIIRNSLIVLTIILTVVYIIDFFVNRHLLYEYFEKELEFKGMGVHLIHLMVDIMFWTIIILIVLYTALYLYFIVGEKFTGTLVVTILNIVSLLYGLTEVTKMLGPTPLEIILAFIQVILGLIFVYFLRKRTIIENNAENELHRVYYSPSS